jgi:SAM-dependent methyltransferase
MYPCDEPEKDRMDIYHQFFAVARRGQLHQAPVPTQPNVQPRILDVGCGTGIWAIDMADKYLNAEVRPRKLPATHCCQTADVTCAGPRLRPRQHPA